MREGGVIFLDSPDLPYQAETSPRTKHAMDTSS